MTPEVLATFLHDGAPPRTARRRRCGRRPQTILRLPIDNKLEAIEEALIAEALALSGGNKSARRPAARRAPKGGQPGDREPARRSRTWTITATGGRAVDQKRPPPGHPASASDPGPCLARSVPSDRRRVTCANGRQVAPISFGSFGIRSTRSTARRLVQVTHPFSPPAPRPAAGTAARAGGRSQSVPAGRRRSGNRAWQSQRRCPWRRLVNHV